LTRAFDQSGFQGPVSAIQVLAVHGFNQSGLFGPILQWRAMKLIGMTIFENF
jgi:hypothetical protein